MRIFEELWGDARELGYPVPRKDTFMGLYYPYWLNFGRWYHVIYPTREAYFRDAAGVVPYDYILALVDSRAYWGVGNFKSHTAIPDGHSSFEYLLLHEIGHYFGLNEEYSGGGRTELEFAPDIAEPWSQNITFNPELASLKWASFVEGKTPVPTPDRVWKDRAAYGAYRGGYAQSPSLRPSHIPGKSCVMDRGRRFCDICQDAIERRLEFDLGRPQIDLPQGMPLH